MCIEYGKWPAVLVENINHLRHQKNRCSCKAHQISMECFPSCKTCSGTSYHCNIAGINSIHLHLRCNFLTEWSLHTKIIKILLMLQPTAKLLGTKHKSQGLLCSARLACGNQPIPRIFCDQRSSGSFNPSCLQTTAM